MFNEIKAQGVKTTFPVKTQLSNMQQHGKGLVFLFLFGRCSVRFLQKVNRFLSHSQIHKSVVFEQFFNLQTQF